MEELNKKRKEYGDLEKSQMNLFKKLEIEKQQRFDNALTSESLLHIQFLNDLQINSDKLTEWHGKAKNDDQRKQLLSMIKALWRVQTYTETLKTLSKKATAEYLTERSMHRRAMQTILDLKNENKALKAEIEHYEDERE